MLHGNPALSIAEHGSKGGNQGCQEAEYKTALCLVRLGTQPHYSCCCTFSLSSTLFCSASTCKRRAVQVGRCADLAPLSLSAITQCVIAGKYGSCPACSGLCTVTQQRHLSSLLAAGA